MNGKTHTTTRKSAISGNSQQSQMTLWRHFCFSHWIAHHSAIFSTFMQSQRNQSVKFGPGDGRVLSLRLVWTKCGMLERQRAAAHSDTGLHRSRWSSTNRCHLFSCINRNLVFPWLWPMGRLQGISNVVQKPLWQQFLCLSPDPTALVWLPEGCSSLYLPRMRKKTSSSAH